MSEGLAFVLGLLGLGMWRVPSQDHQMVESMEGGGGGAGGLLSRHAAWDTQRVFVWVIGMVFLCLIAALSNPSEASFRTYLTELSFRKHLRDLHHPGTSSSSSSSSARHNEEAPSPSSSADHQHAAPTPFRFSNHVAITLRTPGYFYRNSWVLSIVCILPSASAASSERTGGTGSSGTKRGTLVGKNGTKHPRRTGSLAANLASSHDDDVDGWESVTLTGVWFVGAFGRWWPMGSIGRGVFAWPLMWAKGSSGGKSADSKKGGSTASGGKDGDREKGHVGVVNVVALPDVCEDVSQDAIFHVTDDQSGKLAALKHALSHPSNVPRRDHSPPPLRPDVSLPLHTRSAGATDASSRSGGLSLCKADVKTGSASNLASVDHHQHGKSAEVSGEGSRGGQRIGNGYVLGGTSRIAEDGAGPWSTSNPSPLIAELEANLTSSQASVNDLREQLKSLNTSVEQSQLQLQGAVDDLRKKKKEEDSDRAELKTRMKGLEENKRQAEGARREAEKKLKSAEATRDGIQNRIDTMQREIKEMREEKTGCIDAIKSSKEKREEHARTVASQLAEQSKELELVEEEVSDVAKTNADLATKVLKAVEVLQSLIDTSPQAMGPGASDEARYVAGNHPAPDANMLHQPHHLLAEQDGMMHGTMYPGYSGGGAYGFHEPQAMRLSQPGSRPSSRDFHDIHDLNGHQYGNPSFPFSRVPSFKDLSGYEGFGPMGVPVSGGHMGHGHDIYRDPPPAGTIEVDVDEPGSPTGTMSSSFTANLLPQGLFRSLEGDATPVDDRAIDLDDYDAEDDFVGQSHVVMPDDPGPFARQEGEDSTTPPATQSGQDDGEDEATSGGDASSPRQSSGRQPEFDVEQQRDSHREEDGDLSSSPMKSSPRRWFAKVKSGINAPGDLPEHYNRSHANGSTALYGRPLSLTLSNDSLIGPGQGFESAFAPSAAEKRALRWGSIGRWASNRQGGGADLPHFAQRTPAAHLTTPPGSARSSSVDLTARSAWDQASVPHANSGILSGAGGVTDLRGDHSEERSPFRFFSLGKKVSKDVSEPWKDA